MDIMFEIINSTPGFYFIAGLALGYMLRGAFAKSDKNSRAGRYNSVRSVNDVKKQVPTRFTMKEPSFDWLARTPGKSTPEHAPAVLDQPATEI